MKTFSLITLLLSASATVLADFFLYDGAWVTESAEPTSLTRAVSSGDRDNCNGIDRSPAPDGAEGEWSYPWPEQSFTVSLCNANLRFLKNGNDYNVYDNSNGNEVGHCSQGSSQIKSCFWGFISAQYNEAYKCTGAC